ncbi:MAG: cyclic nucleotide-binding domain-containing protein [Bacteroidota bacterium]
MIDTFARISFLKSIHLFHGLKDEDLAMLADQLEEKQCVLGEEIYRQGQKADNFYLVHQGSVKVAGTKKGKEVNASTLVANDYFGYLDLVERLGRTGTATVLTNDTVLLYLSKENFQNLYKKSADFRSNLDLAVRSRKLARSLQFRWLMPGEVIYFLARKHPIILVRNLLGPFLLLFLPALLLLWWVTSWQTFVLLFLAGTFFVFDLLWAVWLIVDWGNDYYIVTNQRVVWLEKVVAVYDSRQESPLNTILAVTVETSLLGRWFDFGNVVVRTFVSKIIFHYVSHPHQAQRMIQEYWDRTKNVANRVEKDAMRAAIRKNLGLKDDRPPTPPPPKKADFPPPRGLAKIFGSFGTDRLRLRYEQGDTVVYRKHWFVLIRRAWIPIVGLMVDMGLFLYRLYVIFTTSATFVSTQDGLSLDVWASVFILLFPIFLAWFIYDFVDWSNDRFEVTNEQIIDVYKKPLSTESRKTSQLENILETEFKRVGLLGQMFNYGDVVIAIGGTHLTFEDVMDPSTVQSDIDRRRMAQKARKEEKDKAARREELAGWLAVYHQNDEKIRQEENERKQKPE